MDETLASVIAAAAAAASAASAAASAASAAASAASSVAVAASSAAVFLATARSANISPPQPTEVGVSGHGFQGIPAQSSDEHHQADREGEVEYEPAEYQPIEYHPNVDKNDSIEQEKSEVDNEDLKRKIIEQVERYFSDQNLRSNKDLARMVEKNKGFVPIEMLASFKKMETLTQDYAFIVSALRDSSLLVVSTDGKKVKRRHSFQLPEAKDTKEKSEVVNEDLKKNIIQQVEHYFSDKYLQSNKKLAGMVAKNKGFVPIEILASFNKMKTLTLDYALIVSALRESSMLVVSNDGKKVKRRHSFQLHEVDTKVVSSDGRKMKQFHPARLPVVKDKYVLKKDKDSLSKKNEHKKRSRQRRGSSKPVSQGSSAEGHETTGYTHRSGIHIKTPIIPRLPDGTKGFAIGRGRPPVS